MKKMLAVLLALVLLAVPALALGEEGEAAPEPAFTGDWFGDLYGMTLKLILNADGTYAAFIVTQPDQPRAGTWTYADGYLYMDGSDTPEIAVVDDWLIWNTFNCILSREAARTYEPAEPLANASLERYAGCWKSRFTEISGAILSSESIGNNTAFYIEGTDIAMTGGMFDDTVLEAVYADGALTWTGEGGVSLTFQFQQDGFIRLTATDGNQSVALYCLPYVVEGLNSEPAA